MTYTLSDTDVDDLYQRLREDFTDKEEKLEDLDDVRKREKILSRLLDICEALVGFCQEQALSAESEEDDGLWTKRANHWIKKKDRVERELDEIGDEMDEPPLPDREKKDGKWVDIEY